MIKIEKTRVWRKGELIALMALIVAILAWLGVPYVAYPGTSGSPQYYCSVDTTNNRVLCTLTSNDFWGKGTAALNGVGIHGISQAWTTGLQYWENDQWVNKIVDVNKCKVTFSISGGLCPQGSCFEGCALSGACPDQPFPSKTFTSVEGTISGDACVWDTLEYESGCCFGEVRQPPSLSGSLEFYYGDICEPNWVCGDWGLCVNQIQERQCDDGCGNQETEQRNCAITECGNEICEVGEDEVSCPEDCAYISVCGNGICESDETYANCPADCEEPVCVEGWTKNYVCSDGSNVPWCTCVNGAWDCITSQENQCDEEEINIYLVAAIIIVLALLAIGGYAYLRKKK